MACIRPDRLIFLPGSGPRRVRRWRLRCLERAWRLRIESKVARGDKLIHWDDQMRFDCGFIGGECMQIFLTALKDVIDGSPDKQLTPISHTHDPSSPIETSANNMGVIVDIRDQRIVMRI